MTDLTHAPGCFGSAACIDPDGEVCSCCEYLQDCALEAKKTLERIRERVPVAGLLKRLGKVLPATAMAVTVAEAPCAAPVQIAQPAPVAEVPIATIRSERKCQEEAEAEKLARAARGELEKTAADWDAELDALLGEPVATAPGRTLDEAQSAPVRDAAGRDAALPNAPGAEADEEEDETGPRDTDPTYGFPAVEITPNIRAASTQALLGGLNRLSHVWRGRAAPARYSVIRDTVCRISLELNLRQDVAPRFRPMRKPPPNKAGAYADDAHQLSNDRQVIDLHWLWSRKADVRPPNRRWQALMTDNPFNFELASAFAATGGSADKKATEILRLRARLQWQLAAIQSKPLADRWRVIENGRADSGSRGMSVDDVREQLQEAALSAHPIGPRIDDWVIVWKCWRLTGDKPKLLSELVAYATGQPKQDASNLKKRVKKILGYLA